MPAGRERSALPMKSLSVLVADDEEDIRVLLEAWLAEERHSMMTVGHAGEAVTAMAQRKFDLVITDVLMPHGDGLELIHALKREQPGARILAISGGGRYLVTDDCLRMARGLGAHAMLMKPFSKAQLLAGMAQALAPEAGADSA